MSSFTIKLVVLLALGGLFSYLVLPGLIESQLMGRMQAAFGAPTKPDVEVSSSFPSELLLGRIDRIQVRTDQMSLQGVILYNVRADLRGAKGSVSSLLEESPSIETRRCTMSVESPSVSIDENQQCLGYLDL
jgi:hypothetical protein